MYFNPNNPVSYVLTTFLNREYVSVNSGQDFGLTDLVYSIYKKSQNVTSSNLEVSCNGHQSDITLENWYEDQNLSLLKRQFTVQSHGDFNELYTLEMIDVEQMKLEFKDQYDVLFKLNVDRIAKIVKTKEIALASCELQQIKWISDSAKNSNQVLKYDFKKIMLSQIDKMTIAEVCEHYKEPVDETTSKDIKNFFEVTHIHEHFSRQLSRKMSNKHSK